MFVPETIVICGAGLHGCALAYYLTLRGHRDVTVVERVEVAAAASGKGGGFLARDWGSGPTTALHQASFSLHEQLAKELGVESYRRLPVLQVCPGPGRTKACPWLDGEVASVDMMDADGGAQVAPKELCEKLMGAAVAKGAKLVIGTVEGVRKEEEEEGLMRVTGVVVDGEVRACDAAVITMGPWSALAQDWLGLEIPMIGVKSTSVVYKTKEPVEPFALFCGEDDRYGTHLEVYPRQSEVYICGVGGSVHVEPEQLRAGEFPPEAVHADPDRVKAAAQAFSGMSRRLGGEPDVSQACMRPCPPDAMPLMGKVPAVKGAYISAGHNCWGILWAPVSGLAMSELILDGAAACVDLGAFEPSRFMRAAGGGRGRKRGIRDVGEQW